MSNAAATALITTTVALLAALLAGWVAWLLTRVQRDRTRQRAELQGRLIDRIDNREALEAFLESETGRRFFDREELPGVAGEIVAATRRGIVLTFLALAFLLLRGFFPEYGATTVIGLLLLAAGAGLMLAAKISERQARRFGLTDGRGAAATPRETRSRTAEASGEDDATDETAGPPPAAM